MTSNPRSPVIETTRRSGMRDVCNNWQEIVISILNPAVSLFYNLCCREAIFLIYVSPDTKIQNKAQRIQLNSWGEVLSAILLWCWFFIVVVNCDLSRLPIYLQSAGKIHDKINLILREPFCHSYTISNNLAFCLNYEFISNYFTSYFLQTFLFDMRYACLLPPKSHPSPPPPTPPPSPRKKMAYRKHDRT